MSQIPTRRFVKIVLVDAHFLVRCKLSKIGKLSADETTKSSQARLFSQLVDILDLYLAFEVDDQTGDTLSDQDVLQQHFVELQILQRIAFKHFEELRPLALTSVSKIGIQYK